MVAPKRSPRIPHPEQAGLRALHEPRDVTGTGRLGGRRTSGPTSPVWRSPCHTTYRASARDGNPWEAPNFKKYIILYFYFYSLHKNVLK